MFFARSSPISARPGEKGQPAHVFVFKTPFRPSEALLGLSMPTMIESAPKLSDSGHPASVAVRMVGS